MLNFAENSGFGILAFSFRIRVFQEVGLSRFWGIGKNVYFCISKVE